MAEEGVSFRSLFPHEAQSVNDKYGYIHLQGNLTPMTTPMDWDVDQVKQMLEQVFIHNSGNSSSSGMPCVAIKVEVMDPPPPTINDNDEEVPGVISKARLFYESHEEARWMVAWLRHYQHSPYTLFTSGDDDDDDDWSTKRLQSTQITTQPLLDHTWNRSNPPKFRRFLHHSGTTAELVEKMQRERNTTRFLFLTNFIVEPLEEQIDGWKLHSTIVDAIRKVFQTYDSTTNEEGEGGTMEVFTHHINTKKKSTPYKHIHIGMSNHADAQHLLESCQGKCLELQIGSTTVQTGALFIDYAGITVRSHKSNKHGTNKRITYNDDGESIEQGESPRPICTSTTNDVLVPGLIILENFISQEEHDVLISTISGPDAPWAPEQKCANLLGNLKRRVQHYGYIFDYETSDVARTPLEIGIPPPIPSTTLPMDTAIQQGNGWATFANIVTRLQQTNFQPYTTTNIPQSSHHMYQPETTTSTNTAVEDGLYFPDINQITVNEYKPGEGIGSHIDTLSSFDDGIFSLTLNASTVMELTNHSQNIKKLIHLAPRSLLVLSGDARWTWEHMIVSRKTDLIDGKLIPRQLRLSLTLRTALTACDNPRPMPPHTTTVFPPKWTSTTEQTPTVENPLATPETERKHVHAVYDAIAKQWNHTRGKRGVLWPGATDFLQKYVQPNSIIADVGCGDGKYFSTIWQNQSFVIGTDISLPLLKTTVNGCKDDGPINRQVSVEKQGWNKRPPIAVADCINLPLRTNSCDGAICIAVLHHLSTTARRLQCLKELARIVKVGGYINVQAWAKEQTTSSKRQFSATDVFVPFHAQPRYLNIDDDNDDNNLKTDTNSEGVAQMYSQAFDGAEYNETKGLVVFQRYCHLYRQGELESLVEILNDRFKLVQSGFESGNYFLILQVIQ